MNIKVQTKLTVGNFENYDSFKNFVSSYSIATINDETYPFLQTVLNDTVERCKQQSKTPAKCDTWGEAFGMPFGHG